ncbi:MAG: hypothetical protein WC758_00320 [Candidatus Woesearchaeota archaeon]|jgi:hypothetical protein
MASLKTNPTTNKDYLSFFDLLGSIQISVRANNEEVFNEKKIEIFNSYENYSDNLVDDIVYLKDTASDLKNLGELLSGTNIITTINEYFSFPAPLVPSVALIFSKQTVSAKLAYSIQNQLDEKRKELYEFNKRFIDAQDFFSDLTYISAKKMIIEDFINLDVYKKSIKFYEPKVLDAINEITDLIKIAYNLYSAVEETSRKVKFKDVHFDEEQKNRLIGIEGVLNKIIERENRYYKKNN